MISFFRHHKIFGGVVTPRKQAALSIHLVYKPVRFVCARTGPQLSVFFSLDMGMFYFRFVLLTFGLYICVEYQYMCVCVFTQTHV